jgi:hypothetical protein
VAGAPNRLGARLACEHRSQCIGLNRQIRIVGGTLGDLDRAVVDPRVNDGYWMPFILALYAQQVLGFSALEFGLSSAVFPLTVAVAAISDQGLVLKIGFRPVAAAGFILLAGGSLYLAQVSPHGSYFGDIFLGLIISGLGTGFAFVTLSIAAWPGSRSARPASHPASTTPRFRSAPPSAPRSPPPSRSRAPATSSRRATTAWSRSPRASSRRSRPASSWPASACR